MTVEVCPSPTHPQLCFKKLSAQLHDMETRLFSHSRLTEGPVAYEFSVISESSSTGPTALVRFKSYSRQLEGLSRG